MIQYIDAADCPHTEPDEDSDAWDAWDDWHPPTPRIGRICLFTVAEGEDAPPDDLTLTAMRAYDGTDAVALDEFDPGEVAGMREALAAATPLIREQVAAEIEAATPKITVLTGAQQVFRAKAMHRAAEIARGEASPQHTGRRT